MKVFIVMPAFNEGKKIGKVLKDLKSHGYNDIVVVDDGSRDDTAAIAESYGANIIKHVINLGYGAANITANEYAFRIGADVAVTIDADGQHDVRDIAKVLKPILEEDADIVIGVRTINKEQMPLIRRIGNFGLSLFTSIAFGVWSSDSQSGFKAITKSAWRKMDISCSGFEYSSEIIQQVSKNRLKFVEVPIKVIYTKYSLSKGQSVIGGIKTFSTILRRMVLK